EANRAAIGKVAAFEHRRDDQAVERMAMGEHNVSCIRRRSPHLLTPALGDNHLDIIAQWGRAKLAPTRVNPSHPKGQETQRAREGPPHVTGAEDEDHRPWLGGGAANPSDPTKCAP